MSLTPRPPAPLDDWGRFACGRDRFGHVVWVRPRHMAERHEAIEHLDPRHALSVLEHWIWDDFRLVEALHDRDPDLLWPGDPVRILARVERVDTAETGRRHRYVVKPAARWLRVVLHGFDRRPLVNERYVLGVQGRRPVVGTTSPQGLLEEPIPASAVHATVEVAGYRWELAVGALVPTANVPDDGHRGATQRLSNLGYPARDTPHGASVETASTDAHDDAFDVEVWRFQRQEAMASTGVTDQGVIDRSVKRHLV